MPVPEPGGQSEVRGGQDHANYLPGQETGTQRNQEEVVCFSQKGKEVHKQKGIVGESKIQKKTLEIFIQGKSRKPYNIPRVEVARPRQPQRSNLIG